MVNVVFAPSCRGWNVPDCGRASWAVDPSTGDWWAYDPRSRSWRAEGSGPVECVRSILGEADAASRVVRAIEVPYNQHLGCEFEGCDPVAIYSDGRDGPARCERCGRVDF